MRPVSADFDPSQAHTYAVRVTLVETGEELPISSGSVTLSSDAEIRATADLTIPDDTTYLPTDAASALAPTGGELQLERGIVGLDGEVEYVSIAIVRIEQARVADSGLSIQITGLDRAKKYIDAQFEEPYQVASGTNAITAIETLLQSVDSAVEMDFPTTSFTTPLLLGSEGETKWRFAQGLAKYIGRELYFDGDGVARLVNAAASAGSVFTLTEGVGGILTEVDVDWDREQAVNRVIVTGENPGETGTIPRGVATNENPDSSTYYYAGPKPMFFASEFVTTQEQADDAAASLLAKNLGITKSVSFGAVVHPALEPGDTITINRERIGLQNETHVIDQLTIPLDESEMSGQTRVVRVT